MALAIRTLTNAQPGIFHTMEKSIGINLPEGIFLATSVICLFVLVLSAVISASADMMSACYSFKYARMHIRAKWRRSETTEK